MALPKTKHPPIPAFPGKAIRPCPAGHGAILIPVDMN
jgi:hypothetical protein